MSLSMKDLNMKFLLITALALISFASPAQLKGFSIGPFAEYGSPVGKFKETHNNGYGAGLGADIRLGKIGVTGSVGYMQFGGQRINTGDGFVRADAIKAVPIRVGLKYRIVRPLYAKLETGMAKFTGGDESAFIFSPGIGIRILGFDMQAKYELWKADRSYCFLGLKAGINF